MPILVGDRGKVVLGVGDANASPNLATIKFLGLHAIQNNDLVSHAKLRNGRELPSPAGDDAIGDAFSEIGATHGLAAVADVGQVIAWTK